MSGTKEGGKKAAAKMKAKYGDNFFANIGRKGGMNGHTGGFAGNKELARVAGKKGGMKSRRSSAMQDKLLDYEVEIGKLWADGISIRVIAKEYHVSDCTMKRFLIERGMLKSGYTGIKKYSTRDY